MLELPYFLKSLKLLIKLRKHLTEDHFNKCQKYRPFHTYSLQLEKSIIHCKICHHAYTMLVYCIIYKHLCAENKISDGKSQILP